MRSSTSHRGAAMAEFAVVALPLLLAGFLTLETGRWLLARQAAAYALFEAARAGSALGPASPKAAPGAELAAAIDAAFERALAPGLAVPDHATPDSLQRAVQARLASWHATHGLPMARIEQVPDPYSLRLKLTYLHPPLAPGARAVLRGLASASEPDGYVRQAREKGLLVIRKEVSLPMRPDSRGMRLSGPLWVPPG